MKAVFFDKDGTLIRDVPYNVNPDLIKLNKSAAELVRAAKAFGFRVFVVSNQSGVARGMFEESDLAAVWARLNRLCAVEFDGFYFCPHHASGVVERYKISCDCRKPAPGMLLRAAREHNLDLPNSWMIGDALSDVEAGRQAGCQTILLDHNDAIKHSANKNRQPHFTIKNLIEAVTIISDAKQNAARHGETSD